MISDTMQTRSAKRDERRIVSFDAQEIAEWCDGAWDSHAPTGIAGVSNDTRTLHPGNLYFAIAGDRLDGHDYVDQAFEHGASAAVVRRDWSVREKGMCLLRVADTRRALGDVARGYRRKVNPDIVGVTGSAGKTSVKDMTAHILAAHTPTARSRGNWNNDIGLPLSLLAMDLNSRVGVFEVATNHPGEISALCGILEPVWGVVTNIGAAHIGYFGSIEHIAEEKASLLRNLPAEGIAFLDCDDAYYGLLRESAPSRVVTISARAPADYCISKTVDATGIQIEEQQSGTSQRFELEHASDFHAVNLAFAVATARSFGMPWDAIVDALGSFTPPVSRWQVEVRNGVRVVNDAYNANPLSMRAALCAYEQFVVPGRKWLVLGGMLELGAEEDREHATLGERVAQGNWTGLIVVGELGEKIARAAMRAGWAAAATHCFPNKTETAAALRDLVRAGDAVLLKASHVYQLDELVDAFVAEDGRSD